MYCVPGIWSYCVPGIWSPEFGLASVSPWPGVGAKPETFTITAGIWLIVTQWLSAAIGGYLAGRLRARWHALHTDEVFFRDTAHGLITWATATVVIAVIAVAAGSLAAMAPAPADVTVTKEAADTARKVAATFATFTGLSMIVGAFVASVAAAIGGRLRDRHPETAWCAGWPFTRLGAFAPGHGLAIWRQGQTILETRSSGCSAACQAAVPEVVAWLSPLIV